MTELKANTQDRNNFINDMLDRLHRHEVNTEKVLAGSLPENGKTTLNKSGNFRLFFLMRGHVSLSGKPYGTHTVRAMEFILIPPFEDICCGAFKRSDYIIVDCSGLENSRNTTYLNSLSNDGSWHGYSPFPVREQLRDIVRYLFVNSDDEFLYFSVCDVLFIMLRMSYTHEEMESMFYPIIENMTGSLNN